MLQELITQISDRYDPKRIAATRHGCRHHMYSAPQLATLPVLARQRKQNVYGDKRLQEALNADYWISCLPGDKVTVPDGTQVDTAIILDIYHADNHGESFFETTDPTVERIRYKLTPIHPEHGLRKLIGKTISWSPLPPVRWADLVSNQEFRELGKANEPPVQVPIL
jgi:hypothetical protein